MGDLLFLSGFLEVGRCGIHHGFDPVRPPYECAFLDEHETEAAASLERRP
jgi:hypothetical protein